jgi:iron complex transport system substrate-binding protein
MKPIKRKLFGLFLACLFLVSCPVLSGQAFGAEKGRRIISLAPSLTEILYTLDLGDRVKGVSDYCDYPPEVASKPKLGGLMDPGYEAMVALKPDLAILLTSHRDAKRELEKLGIPTLTVPHQTLRDIHESIRMIGEACGAEERAADLLELLDRRTSIVSSAVEGLQRPKVLISIGRDMKAGGLASFYTAGRNGFYDEIIGLAGGVNAYGDEKVPYPQLSAEGVIRLNPDVIIDLVSDMKPLGMGPEDVAAQWDRLRTVAAVRKGRVHVIEGYHALRPGPRYFLFLEQLARLLHPEIFEKYVRNN